MPPSSTNSKNVPSNADAKRCVPASNKPCKSASMPPKKRGADPPVPLRSKARKPRQGPAATDHVPGNAEAGAALVGQSLSLLDARRLSPRRRVAFGGPSEPTLATAGLPPDGGSLLRHQPRGSPRTAGRPSQRRDASDRQREAWSADGRLANAGYDQHGGFRGGVGRGR